MIFTLMNETLSGGKKTADESGDIRRHEETETALLPEYKWGTGLYECISEPHPSGKERDD